MWVRKSNKYFAKGLPFSKGYSFSEHVNSYDQQNKTPELELIVYSRDMSTVRENIHIYILYVFNNLFSRIKTFH